MSSEEARLFRKVLVQISRKLDVRDVKDMMLYFRDELSSRRLEQEVQSATELLFTLEDVGIISAPNDLQKLGECLDALGRTDLVLVIREFYESMRGTHRESGESRTTQVSVSETGEGGGELCGSRERVIVEADAIPFQSDWGASNAGEYSKHRESHKQKIYAQENKEVEAKERNQAVVVIQREKIREEPLNEQLFAEINIVSQQIGRAWRQLARLLHVRECEIEEITYQQPHSLREQCYLMLVAWCKQRNPHDTTSTVNAIVRALQACGQNYLAHEIIQLRQLKNNIDNLKLSRQ